MLSVSPSSHSTPPAQRKGHVRPQQRSGHLQTRKSLIRNRTPLEPDLGLPASRTVRGKFLSFKPPGQWCCVIAARTDQDRSMLGTALPGFRSCKPPWLRLRQRPWDHKPLRRQTLSPRQGCHLCSLYFTLLGSEPDRLTTDR